MACKPYLLCPTTCMFGWQVMRIVAKFRSSPITKGHNNKLASPVKGVGKSKAVIS